MNKQIKKLLSLALLSSLLITSIGCSNGVEATSGATDDKPTDPPAQQEQQQSRENDPATLTDEEIVKVGVILENYDPDNITVEDALAINEAIRDAGIHGGRAVGAAMREFGFDNEVIKELAPPPDRGDKENDGGAKTQGEERPENGEQRPEQGEDGQQPPQEGEQANQGGQGNYSMSQAMSDNAQLTTIAYSGLAFITGSEGADTFMPPGKVADFFGFQYMRDVDEAGYGHNTTFLTKAANNILDLLTDTQKAKLIELAEEQTELYNDFAYNRYPLLKAFRMNLEGDQPSGASDLDLDQVAAYTKALYEFDADLSYERAVVLGDIVQSFSADQIATLDSMEFNDSSTWLDVEEDESLKRSMDHDTHVALMTYASELFSWYKGSLEADSYFCPERHGTYFGGFFMKDYFAMGDPDYFISTSVTGDSGRIFLESLDSEQRQLIEGILDIQKPWLEEIGEIRVEVSTLLRKSMDGETIDKARVYELIGRYGELDGLMSGLYASRFAQVNETLTDAQRATFDDLRGFDIVPDGGYYFSAPVELPDVGSVDYLFGVGSTPSDMGQIDDGEFVSLKNSVR